RERPHLSRLIKYSNDITDCSLSSLMGLGVLLGLGETTICDHVYDCSIRQNRLWNNYNRILVCGLTLTSCVRTSVQRLSRELGEESNTLLILAKDAVAARQPVNDAGEALLREVWQELEELENVVGVERWTDILNLKIRNINGTVSGRNCSPVLVQHPNTKCT
ncbi:unnamed protein product, partial [Amoebophrya sp. A25]